MKKYIEDVGNIKTPKVYCHSLQYEDYKIISYVPTLGFHNNEPYLPDDLKERLDCFDKKYKHEYVVGTGKPIYITSEYRPLTFEWFQSVSHSSDDTSLLQKMLSLGRKVVIEDCYRKAEFGDTEKELVLSFCRRYGLNSNELPSIMVRNKDNPHHLNGFNLWSFLQGIQTLYFSFDESNKLQDAITQDIDEFAFHVSGCSAQLYSQCHFSEKKQRIISTLSANSLLDLANYQLGMVLSNGVYTRKCANPACSQILIGGRNDKSTCSDACRQAVSRLNKKIREDGETNAKT